MVEYGVGVAFMVLSPVALLTCVVAAVVIAHYRTYLHGTDLCFLSLFACLFADVIFLIPIPGIMAIKEVTWSQPLCYFYIWLSVTVRVGEILTVLSMCVHWMTILRLPSGKQVYGSTKSVKICLVIVWCLAIVIGIMPLIGATNDGYPAPGVCLFLPNDLGISFVLFFILLSISTVVLSFICATDTVLLLHYMRHVAVVKYQAGRFYLPSTSAVAKTGSQTVHARYNELNFSSDLCRLVLAVVVITAVINHLPFTIIEFIQLVGSPSRSTVQTAVHWMLLLQSLTLPHTLWLISKRYRHALVYTWKVYFLRDSAAEEEAQMVHIRHTLWPDPTNRRRGIWKPNPSACTLQSYTRNVRDVDGQTVRVTARGPGQRNIAVVSNRGASNHVANGQVVRANGNAVQGASNYFESEHRNGFMVEVDTTDLDDGMTVMTNTNSRHIIHQGTNSVQTDSASASNSARSSFHASPAKSLLSTPVRGNDLRRTASSSSRMEWKEQMRRKHLPTIFVNEAFDAEDAPSENKMASPKRTEPKEKRKTGSDVSLYYMSSDYHHDNLADGMPHIKHQESESEGASNTYGDDDIDNILDVQQTAVADTSMSKDMDEAFNEVLSGVNSEFDVVTTETNQDMEDFVPSPETEGTGVDLSDITIEGGEEMGSPRSNHSIVIEPYQEERRPPWLNEDDISPRSESGYVDHTSPGSSHPPESNPQSPVIQFDSDIDRGFEEALSYNYPPGYAPGGLGLCFESIKEEPEDSFSEEGGIEAELSADNVFKTHAVVSSRSSSRTSSTSDRPILEDSRSDCVPINGVEEAILEEQGSEDELREYEKNYKGPLTSFGRFYNNPASSDTVGLTPFGTFGYSEDGPPASPRYGNDVSDAHGNQEHLKPLEHIDHDDSFYADRDEHLVPGVTAQTFFTGNAGQNGTDDQTYYFDGKDGAWSNSEAPDVSSLKHGMQSLGPWPENEDDLDDIDMSFDSDFSEVSTSNSPSDVTKPQINGFVTSNHDRQSLNESTEDDRPTAFF